MSYGPLSSGLGVRHRVVNCEGPSRPSQVQVPTICLFVEDDGSDRAEGSHDEDSSGVLLCLCGKSTVHSVVKDKPSSREEIGETGL